jgi:hypothetical protein
MRAHGFILRLVVGASSRTPSTVMKRPEGVKVSEQPARKMSVRSWLLGSLSWVFLNPTRQSRTPSVSAWAQCSHCRQAQPQPSQARSPLPESLLCPLTCSECPPRILPVIPQWLFRFVLFLKVLPARLTGTMQSTMQFATTRRWRRTARFPARPPSAGGSLPFSGASRCPAESQPVLPGPL